MYSGEVIHYWRFHFWRVSSHWYRISLSFYPNEILDYIFCQQDKLGIWPACSCNQEYLLRGCVKIVLFLSGNRSPPRPLGGGMKCGKPLCALWGSISVCCKRKLITVYGCATIYIVKFGWVTHWKNCSYSVMSWTGQLRLNEFQSPITLLLNTLYFAVIGSTGS